MLEAAWIVLLAASLRDWRFRSLAVLLAAKWALSYLSFIYIAEWMPMVTDALMGILCVSTGRLTRRREVVTGLFVTTLLIHATYWTAWEHGVWLPLAYKTALIVTYTLMLFTLQPWEKVRAGVDRRIERGVAWWNALAGKVASDRNAG